MEQPASRYDASAPPEREATSAGSRDQGGRGGWQVPCQLPLTNQQSDIS